MSPRYGSLNKWRQTESTVVEGGYTLNETKIYDITTFWSPERKEAIAQLVVIEQEDTLQIHPKAQYHHGFAA